jgi:MYXO-CTERM domain-containing protein
MTSPLRLLALASLAAVWLVTSGFGSFAAEVPTSYSCSTCHFNPGGGGARNPFGLDFDRLGDWSTAPAGDLPLWALDSDGDGFTNGEELGDPSGTWRPRAPVLSTSRTSRPGDSTSRPVCPDGILHAIEECDEGSRTPTGGCIDCLVEFDWSCTGTPSICTFIGIVVEPDTGSDTGPDTSDTSDTDPGDTTITDTDPGDTAVTDTDPGDVAITDTDPGTDTSTADAITDAITDADPGDVAIADTDPADTSISDTDPGTDATSPDADPGDTATPSDTDPADATPPEDTTVLPDTTTPPDAVTPDAVAPDADPVDDVQPGDNDATSTPDSTSPTPDTSADASPDTASPSPDADTDTGTDTPTADPASGCNTRTPAAPPALWLIALLAWVAMLRRRTAPTLQPVTTRTLRR